MEVVADDEQCQGHGRCYDLAPGVFAPDDDGHVIVLAPDGHVATDDEAEAALAVRSCPERALSVEH